MTDAMTEEDIIKFHEEHKGDLSIWADKPVAAQVKKGSTVFSLRFSRDELALLRTRAELEGVTVAEFIRRAAMREAASPLFVSFLPDPTYALSWGTTASASAVRSLLENALSSGVSGTLPTLSEPISA